VIEFSFVIPTRDRPQHLAESIDALARVNASGFEWEAVIVDDGSKTPVAAPSGDTLASNAVRVVRDSGRGPATARNTGAKHANGRILVFIDDDCRADAEILNALHAHYRNQRDALVGGRIEHGCYDNFWSTVTHTLTKASYVLQEERDRKPRRFSTSILAVPREPFVKLGGFNENYPLPGGEDYELCERWANKVGPACYLDAAFVTHVHPLTLRQFVRQQLNYGRGIARSHRLSAHHPQRRTFATKLRDIAGIVAYPFRTLAPLPALRLSAGVLMAQALTAIGAATESRTLHAHPAESAG